MDPERRDEARWERLLAYGQARMREKLQAEGLDIDAMTDDEKMEYVDRVIHEHRQQAAAKSGTAATSTESKDIATGPKQP